MDHTVEEQHICRHGEQWRIFVVFAQLWKWLLLQTSNESKLVQVPMRQKKKNCPGQKYGVREDPHGTASCTTMKWMIHQARRHEPSQTQHTGRAAEQGRMSRSCCTRHAAPAKTMFPKSFTHRKEDNGLKYSSAVWFIVTVVRRDALRVTLGAVGPEECESMLVRPMGFIKSFRGETGVPQWGCLFSEGSAAVTMIEPDGCLVVAASGLRAAH